MTAKRFLNAVACGLVSWLFVVAGGCGWFDEDICFLNTPQSSHRLSPDGRAVAFINSVAFDYLLYNRDYLTDFPDCKFNCVVREFSRLFSNSPDSTIQIL